jgi:hypothetical protein
MNFSYRFYAEIQATTGQERKLRKRGRPKKVLPDTGNQDGDPELPF